MKTLNNVLIGHIDRASRADERCLEKIRLEDKSLQMGRHCYE